MKISSPDQFYEALNKLNKDINERELRRFVRDFGVLAWSNDNYKFKTFYGECDKDYLIIEASKKSWSSVFTNEECFRELIATYVHEWTHYNRGYFASPRQSLFNFTIQFNKKGDVVERDGKTLSRKNVGWFIAFCHKEELIAYRDEQNFLDLHGLDQSTNYTQILDSFVNDDYFIDVCIKKCLSALKDKKYENYFIKTAEEGLNLLVSS